MWYVTEAEAKTLSQALLPPLVDSVFGGDLCFGDIAYLSPISLTLEKYFTKLNCKNFFN
jgi:hypothetical protein